METHSLVEYKNAKVMLPHLGNILRIVNLSITGLSYYKSYLPVVAILSTLQEQKSILEIYQGRYKRIIENKGRKP